MKLQIYIWQGKHEKKIPYKMIPIEIQINEDDEAFTRGRKIAKEGFLHPNDDGNLVLYPPGRIFEIRYIDEES